MSTFATLASLAARLLRASSFRFAMFFPPTRSLESKAGFVECERQATESLVPYVLGGYAPLNGLEDLR
jgi:hypothetical protein